MQDLVYIIVHVYEYNIIIQYIYYFALFDASVTCTH